MTFLPIALGLAAAITTLAGGLVGLRLRRRTGLILGLTAGVVLGVALFDLIPEAMELARGRLSLRDLGAWIVAGLGLYLLMDRLLSRTGQFSAGWRAHLGPAILTAHSFFDGLGIGLAFQIDRQIGWLVAVAVLTHDLADGVNVVSLCISAQVEGAAKRWLVLNGLSPLMGVLVGLNMAIDPVAFAPLLAVFAGIFFYIGACELLPRSHAIDPRLGTALASLAGATLMFVVTMIAS